MASTGCCTLRMCANLKALEMLPASRPALFKCLDLVRSSYISPKIRFSSALSTIVVKAASAATVEEGSYRESDTIPTPKVIIDQGSDPDATVVEITFGDGLGALLDTVGLLLLWTDAKWGARPRIYFLLKIVPHFI